MNKKFVQIQKKCTFAKIKKVEFMDKITIVMSLREYKKYLAYKEADKIVKSIQRGLREAQKARKGKRKLKSAYELANEL